MAKIYFEILIFAIVALFLFSPQTYPLAKRLFDFLTSLTVFFISLILFVPIIIILRFSGEGEVFYFQKRVGFKNKQFYIWKFATMLKDSPNIGTGTITVRNDPRVTKFGKYLRKSKINELPQIINVMKGDMSLVGPRPLDNHAFKAYTPAIQKVVYSSRPGMTGIGSIFFRDEETIIHESNLSPRECYKQVIAPYKGELEKWYNRRKSFITDIVLIVLTIFVIIFPRLDLASIIIRDLPKFEKKS